MYERENARRLILLGVIVVVLVILVGAFFLFRGGGSSGKATPVVQTKTVVVAAISIPQGTTLNVGTALSTYFTTQSVPVNVVPTSAYASVAQIQQLIASAPKHEVVTTQTVFAKAVIVSGMFSTLGQFTLAQGTSFVIPFGYVGIAIAFDPINSVIGSITNGDTIDIITSYHGKIS